MSPARSRKPRAGPSRNGKASSPRPASTGAAAEAAPARRPAEAAPAPAARLSESRPTRPGGTDAARNSDRQDETGTGVSRALQETALRLRNLLDQKTGREKRALRAYLQALERRLGRG